MTKSKIALMCLGLGLFSISCEKESITEEKNPASDSKLQTLQKDPSLTLADPAFPGFKIPGDLPAMSENIGRALFSEAVEPSECGPTELDVVQRKYIIPIIQDPVALEYYQLYLDLNFIHAYFIDNEEQYFGPEGEDTQLMVKRQRELEKFWNMPDQILVKGQHLETLNDREKIADVFEMFGVDVNSREEAYAIADEILALNEMSPNLPENPFFATDGFASSNGTIVIGDGIVQWMAETGVDRDVVWTGILAHEWAHEIQFSNYEQWYPNGAAEDPAEDTRYTELEADFLAAYYMTHKRGATYNQKRAEQFFNLFFQIGDCGFSSPGHHGTPAQRMAAARLGFDLAAEAQKQGHILSQEDAHAYFVANIDTIL